MAHPQDQSESLKKKAVICTKWSQFIQYVSEGKVQGKGAREALPPLSLLGSKEMTGQSCHSLSLNAGWNTGNIGSILLVFTNLQVFPRHLSHLIKTKWQWSMHMFTLLFNAFSPHISE